MFCTFSKILEISVAEKQVYSGFALFLADWGGSLQTEMVLITVSNLSKCSGVTFIALLPAYT